MCARVGMTKRDGGCATCVLSGRGGFARPRARGGEGGSTGERRRQGLSSPAARCSQGAALGALQITRRRRIDRVVGAQRARGADACAQAGRGKGGSTHAAMEVGRCWGRARVQGRECVARARREEGMGGLGASSRMPDWRAGGRALVFGSPRGRARAVTLKKPARRLRGSPRLGGVTGATPPPPPCYSPPLSLRRARSKTRKG